MNPKPLGLYLHVPFCATACEFCAFYQERPKRQALDMYLEAIEKELSATPLEGVDTIFWGGGTPGLLPPEDLERLGQAVLKAVGTSFVEWTVEMAPSVVKPEKLKVLKALGVNRLSMGVQTFDEKMLEVLGRRHAKGQVYQAYDWMREAGFDNINIDLMFALPGQTFEQWTDDLEKAFALAPEHISTYCLTFEEDTALYVKLLKGQTKKKSIDEEGDFYLRTWEKLAQNGFLQYEVSNFAKAKNNQCLHNIHTWQMAEWVGVGPSAASQYKGMRYRNVPAIDRWQAGIFKGIPERDDVVTLTDALLGADSLIFGLRMNEGIDWEAWKKRYGAVFFLESLEKLWEGYVAEGLLLKRAGRIALTDAGRLVADGVGEAILDRIG